MNDSARSLIVTLASCLLFYLAGWLHGVYWSTHHGTQAGESLVQLGLRLLAANQRQVWQSTMLAEGEAKDQITGTLYVVEADAADSEGRR